MEYKLLMKATINLKLKLKEKKLNMDKIIYLMILMKEYFKMR